eukprot:561799_1
MDEKESSISLQRSGSLGHDIVPPQSPIAESPKKGDITPRSSLSLQMEKKEDISTDNQHLEDAMTEEQKEANPPNLPKNPQAIKIHKKKEEQLLAKAVQNKLLLAQLQEMLPSYSAINANWQLAAFCASCPGTSMAIQISEKEA